MSKYPEFGIMWLEYLNTVKFNHRSVIDDKTRKKLGVRRLTQKRMNELYDRVYEHSEYVIEFTLDPGTVAH